MNGQAREWLALASHFIRSKVCTKKVESRTPKILREREAEVENISATSLHAVEGLLK